jgi:mannosyltransferase OCH1-like enzyme
VQSWSTVHPEWEHRIWGEDDLGWLTNQDLFDRAPEIVGPNEIGQFRADIARLEILERHGGVYVDCDMEARKAFDPLLDVECFAGFEDTHGRWVNNAVLGSEPGHPFLAALIERLPASVRRARRKGIRRPNVFSGPQFVTPIWRTGFQDSVTVYPSSHFYPYSWSALDRQSEDFPDAYAVHHWHHRRSKRG